MENLKAAEKIMKLVKVMEQKVKLMHGVGLLPDDHAAQLMSTITLTGPLLSLIVAVTPPDEAQNTDEMLSNAAGLHHIEEVDSFLNEGLGMMKKKLESAECVECGKCVEQKKIIETLLAGEMVTNVPEDLKKDGITESTEMLGGKH